MIREALVEARTELQARQTREAELERQIAHAEAVLGERPATMVGERKMTLHDALARSRACYGRAATRG